MKIRYEIISQLYTFFKGSITSAEISFREKRNILKVVKLFEDDAKLIEEEQTKLIQEFAEKDDKGDIIVNEKGVRFKAENLMKFNKSMSELLTTEVEINEEIEKYKFNEKVFDKISCNDRAIEFIDEHFIERKEEENDQSD